MHDAKGALHGNFIGFFGSAVPDKHHTENSLSVCEHCCAPPNRLAQAVPNRNESKSPHVFSTSRYNDDE
jgi:hypothetical protein